MAPNTKLAKSLESLKIIQDTIGTVFESSDLPANDRRILSSQGFIEPIIKGWYFISNPEKNLQQGNTTLWYSNFWLFISKYLKNRFGEDYIINPDDSLLLHTGSTIIPQQLIVASKANGNMNLTLPTNIKVIIYSDKNIPENATLINELRTYPLEHALCKISSAFYKSNPTETEIAFGLIGEPSKLLSVLLSDERMEASAGRIIGALRFLKRDQDANRIKSTLMASLFTIRETNPFEISTPTIQSSREKSPYTMRIRSMWKKYREDVLLAFKDVSSFSITKDKYLANMQEIYTSDAYHSLSIEGYKVTNDLINRVANHDWNPEKTEEDMHSRNALAARGYYQAFEAVKKTVEKIFDSTNPVDILKNDFHEWYTQLFAPSVTAGIIKPYALAGYRNHQVIIQNSAHSPLPHYAISDAIDVFFELMSEETNACVKAVLGHFIFAFIHPYPDGNGRISRFIMNTMLASGQHPWTVIKVEDRDEYMKSLERASVHGDIKPFALFIVQRVNNI
ncbi:MAG: cell filamentation protein Fic [Erysipelotrichia bacterium]|nr:cell filamentation protein Fic [Erysipelotrichia bacterium]